MEIMKILPTGKGYLWGGTRFREEYENCVRGEAKATIGECYPGCSCELLCRCKYFEAERIQMKKGLSFSVLKNSLKMLII